MKLTTTVAASLLVSTASVNMNGLYKISSTSTNPASSQPFNTDYASKGHEFFDVDSPIITSTYAQVYWTLMDKVPLPQHIVDRFAGNRTMAITGFEIDQIFVGGENKGESVPINWACVQLLYFF